MAEGKAVVVGRVIRGARQSRGLSLRDVGIRSEGALKPTSVASYERGERGISLERFVDLCRLYDMAPVRLLAEITRVLEDRPRVAIDQEQIERLGSAEALLVADFLNEVRRLREAPPGDAITLRAGDVEVLATASGHRAEGLLAKIAPALRPDPSTAR